jgi:hypothetical protein
MIDGTTSTPSMKGYLHSAEVSVPRNLTQIFPQSTQMGASGIPETLKQKARDGITKASNTTTRYFKW